MIELLELSSWSQWLKLVDPAGPSANPPGWFVKVDPACGDMSMMVAGDWFMVASQLV